ncbi:MAG: pseudouridine-5'-phosphate glycosidase [Ardenticatenia bacterium]|nr:pseudouridine-5'-phosphate glycosidase [Ardenticatenia bacterium]
MLSDYIQVSSEVQAALDDNRALVALESTIIAHGMPHPTNVETALEVERIVRDNGAVPTTIGVVGGVIKCGLSEDEIRLFATSSEVLKANERDIPRVVSKGYHAATTVGACLASASALGIRVLVTGGIGGVAPRAGETFDISADLPAIVQYPCITVCAGTKAFMDIPATLEYFETHRVPVASYQSETFPFFYSRDSGCAVDWVAQDVEEIADVFLRKLSMELEGGVFVGVPVPREGALPEEISRRAIRVALERIEKEEITGKAVTPYLLKAITEETSGKSLEANVALIKNNARVGAQIAVALAQRPNSLASSPTNTGPVR